MLIKGIRVLMLLRSPGLLFILTTTTSRDRSLEDFEDFTSLTVLYQHQMFNYTGLMFYIKYGKITYMTTDNVAVFLKKKFIQCRHWKYQVRFQQRYKGVLLFKSQCLDQCVL